MIMRILSSGLDEPELDRYAIDLSLFVAAKLVVLFDRRIDFVLAASFELSVSGGEPNKLVSFCILEDDSRVDSEVALTFVGAEDFNL